MKNSSDDSGFSIVELSVVLVVTGLLMLAVTGIATIIKKSKLEQRILEIETLSIAMGSSNRLSYFLYFPASAFQKHRYARTGI
jgi:prepilin-type N-terminal cleavage/methylation domain-containing protein